MGLNGAIAKAHASEDWTDLDKALVDVFSAVHPPHFYVAALHVTFSERDRLITWHRFRDHLIENSTPDIKKLLTGL